MNLLQMAWRNLMNRLVQTWITVIVVVVGISLTLAIMMISGGVKDGIVRASEPYGMIVGSKGSANQLVFNTIFLMDNPLANLSQEYYRSLTQDSRVTLAVPFALGDNFKGFRIVGTEPSFFTLKATPASPDYFKLRSGRIFGKPFEAVIGSRVAHETGLKVGDTFISGHGVARTAEQEEHTEHPFTVVGILSSVSAPSDQGIYVSMDSYWINHEAHGDGHGAAAAVASAGEDDDHGDEQGVTAVLVKPKSYTDLLKMYQEINHGKDAQAVFPGQVVAKIFDMMGSGQEILTFVSFIVLGMAGLTIILALYGSTLERRRSVSILRAIGAGRSSIVVIVLLESALVVILGCVLGLLFGSVLTWELCRYLGTRMSISIPIHYTGDMVSVLAGVGLLGIAAGIVPAVSAYRTETARYLNSM
jgi:putative ABC transport system permease protein